MTEHPRIARLHLADLTDALRAGWRDFRAAPQFGLFFGAVHVLAGLALSLLGAGALIWTLAISLAFPLFAPFAAVGLYDVSRRLERGAPLDWAGVLGVVWAERGRQMPWIGALIVLYVLFWTFLAHLILALFLGLGALRGGLTTLAPFLTADGLAMLGTELLVGGVLALVLFSLTAMSLPMLLDREVDFVTAMLTSLRCVAENPAVLLTWAALIAVSCLAALLPLFLGLLVVLPVLGHATWHLYRRTLIWGA